ncbi:MAG: PhnD/SsuA/transferrin family substrate-binding protein [Methylococcaceae bacterium]|nr:PhnD/SsuA/transferrin family substrate-binding protein [Methylococcaceae bacterium]MDZ4157958.1 PhnD/SsuA/transferrin family substrate-binding protein [Methylococcales bacterium]MDP2393546.1 PhnD/SsuA/transferrin family substrate-binding protein [Methylococcaceae bacterium]MDP3020778.1 PhnD/SsuA/transferrin family substrate-binding protein [Methylococcaceae bacterium]MDP3390613.1 PhnD/SsuA/transferrin family substrate-binding protein [Methylococcaceae bacterium]
MKTITRFSIGYLLFALYCCFFTAHAEEHIPLDPVMRLGIYYPPISDNVSRADVVVSFSLWVQEQAKSVGVKAADVMLFDSIEEMSEAFDSGIINIISAPPLSIALHFKRENLADGFYGIRAPGKLNSVILLARTDKNINSIKDLRGKRLIIPEHHELAEMFLDTLILKTYHIPYKKLFSSIDILKKDKRIVLDLFFDKADVVLVNEGAFELMKELNPQLNEKIKIIASYPTKSKSYAYVNKNYPFRQKIIDNYLSMAMSVRGRQFLSLYQQDLLEACSVKELDAYDELAKEHQQLLKK